MSDAIREAFEALERVGNYVSVPFEMMVQFADDLDTVKTALQIQTAPSVPEDGQALAKIIKDAHMEGQKSATGREGTEFRWAHSDAKVTADIFLTAAPQPDHIGDAKKMGEVLHRAWYHADEDGDYNIYDALNAECPDCIEVLIVRPDHIADAGKVAPSDWAGWACHKAGKMPRLYGEKSIAEVNCDTENGERLIFLSSTPSVPEEEVKAQALEEFADWLKRQSFAHNKRWTSAANEALRCAKRLRASQQEGNTAGDDGEG